jgi:predicted lipoprotein with Yx(FWY)xxD motif
MDMSFLRTTVQAVAVAAAFGAGAARAADTEDYERAPMPPGFQVISTELEGPVFADAGGKTLYTWPRKNLRNGDTGEQPEKPTCDNTKYTESSGLMSPYPPGLELPELDTRPSCTQVWPPVLAADDAKAVGKWTIVTRKDGAKQWAYDKLALYTSVLDERAGDTRGGARRRTGGDSPAYRVPVSPKPNIPAQFGVYPTAAGRLLATSVGFSVYTYDKDTATKSNCTDDCLKSWAPVLAAETAVTQGEWSVVERQPGIKQWAYRKKPLYTRIAEDKERSQEGSDTPGWHNVYTQRAPTPPKAFMTQDSIGGMVLADSRGKTVYIYFCGDDAIDQLACDHPNSPQAYRLAICGGGGMARCLETFPYVIAAKGETSNSRAWTTADIDPKTGHYAKPGQVDALHVWEFRGRPVFTFSRDTKPGQVGADSWGEFNGNRNGFRAFWLRDDFNNNAG